MFKRARAMSATLIVALAFAGLETACAGSSHTQTAPNGSHAGTENGCAEHAAAVCHRMHECLGPMFRVTFASDADCDSALRADCIDDMTAPGTGFTESNARQCASEVNAASCDDIVAERIPPVCRPHGRLANGATCYQSDQCATANCERTNGNRCGVCVPAPGLGSHCTQHCSGDGLECAPATHVCIRPGTEGAACDPSAAPCGVGLVCSGIGATRTCQRAGTTEGSPCTASPTDTIHACDLMRGLVCDARVGTCRALRLANAGEPCGLVGDGLVGCGSRGRCVGQTSDHPGTCAAPPSLDGPCTVTDSFGCPPMSRCVAPPNRLRGVCMHSDSTICRDGRTPDPREFATPLSVPSTVQGALRADDISLSDDSVADDYGVHINAGDTVTIDAIGGESTSSQGTLLDMYIILMRDGHEVAHDDDSGGDLNSRLVFTSPDSAMYTLRVTTYGSGLKTGAYTLRTTAGALPVVPRDGG